MRSEGSGIAFGLGHAGIEALIFTLLPSLAAIALLSGAADGSIYANLPADSSESLNTAVTFLSGQSFAVATLSITERIFATVLHITLTLFVLQRRATGGRTARTCSATRPTDRPPHVLPTSAPCSSSQSSGSLVPRPSSPR